MMNCAKYYEVYADHNNDKLIKGILILRNNDESRKGIGSMNVQPIL